MSCTITIHRGETKGVSFTTTGSFAGKDVEFGIGKRVSTRELTEVASATLTVSGTGSTVASGEITIPDDAVAGAGYESQLKIIDQGDDSFEIVEGPLVTIKEAITPEA